LAIVRLAFHPLGTRVPSLAHALEKTTRCVSACAGRICLRGLAIADHRSFPSARSTRLRVARAVRTYALLFSSNHRPPVPHLWSDHRLGPYFARQPLGGGCGQFGGYALLCCNPRRRTVVATDCNPWALASGSTQTPTAVDSCNRLAVDYLARLDTPLGFEFLTSSARTNHH